ncbi:MAG TPA: phosphoglycerate dehydrogenase [Candidatus Brocadiia bacterium]|nr:phosphoglycerate dehydrogenase [Candidatus Brocadiia bacterium]
MATNRILIADGLDRIGLQILEDSGLFEITVRDAKKSPPASEMMKDIEGLIVRSATQVDEALLKNADALRLVGRAGVGTDNIDIPACTIRGITVMNTPLGNVTSAAEHAVALMMALARHIPKADAMLKAGKWAKTECTGVELENKTLGILGLGKVGSIVARAGRGLGMSVIAYDPFLSREAAAERGVTLVEFQELLKTSDFITLHVPLSDRTRNCIGYAELSMMKRSARMINCARGGVVNEDDLCRALGEGLIAGAAFDVFSVEPTTQSPLFKLDNVIVTPHLGASTGEAQQKVAVGMAEQFVRFFRDGVAVNAVNVAVNVSPQNMPYIELGRMLGKLLSQTGAGDSSNLEVRCMGKAAAEPQAIALATLTGLLEGVTDQPVNFVNASLMARQRGIRLTVSHSSESRNFSSLVQADASGGKRSRSVAGSLFDGTIARIVSVDGFNLDLEPAPCLLMMRYRDMPGMVGKIGTVLGDAKVNIADMTVSRLNKLGEAVVVLTLDQEPGADVIARISGLVQAAEAYLVQL